VHLGGYDLYVLHDLNELASKPAPEGVAAVICGHSHRASVKTVDGVLYLNRGSAGSRRFKLPITLATLDLDESGEFRPIVHTLG
jgi:uncharacterized protein